MPRQPILAGAFLTVAMLAIACGDKAAPTSPSNRSFDRDREFLEVSGCDELTAFRCTATVRRLPDVIVRDVTQESTWSTNNPAVATITADGRLTLLAGGAITIRASYQAMTASRQVRVSSVRVELRGRVENFFESWEKVPGATIEFVQGPNTGRVTVTDARGYYSFPDVWPTLGGQVVRISHPDYKTGDFWPSVWDHRPVNEFNPRLTPLSGPPGR